MNRSIALLFLIGGLIALTGTYWDDAWHTDIGRDAFAIPPHLVLYSGVAVVGLAVALWAGRTWWQKRRLKTLIQEPALLLAGIGVVATFVSAPIDDFWHRAFGRDAVLWSPPHMLGVAALLVTSAAILLAVGQLADRDTRVIKMLIAALILSAVFVTVMEYESDVPQFSPLWYLPIVTLSGSFAFSMMHIGSDQKWIATLSAVVVMLVRVGIVIFLALMRFSTPTVPPIIFPALVFDLTAHRKFPLLARALLFSVSVYLAYTPFISIALPGLVMNTESLISGFVFAFIGCLAVFLWFSNKRTPHLVSIAAILTVLLVGLPAKAFAHDPGQGQEAGKARLNIQSQELAVTFTIEIVDMPSCDQLTAKTLVARRAGEVLQAPLAKIADCRFEGQIRLSTQGRWFIYAELTQGNEKLETWLPAVVGNATGQAEKVSSLYIPSELSGSTMQTITGTVLYVIDMLLIATVIVFYRRLGRAKRIIE